MVLLAQQPSPEPQVQAARGASRFKVPSLHTPSPCLGEVPLCSVRCGAGGRGGAGGGGLWFVVSGGLWFMGPTRRRMQLPAYTEHLETGPGRRRLRRITVQVDDSSPPSRVWHFRGRATRLSRGAHSDVETRSWPWGPGAPPIAGQVLDPQVGSLQYDTLT